MRIYKTIFPTLLLIAVYTGCNKPDSDNNAGPNTPVSLLSASVNGSTFVGNQNTIAATGDTLIIKGGTSTGSKSSYITLAIPHYVTLSAYNVDSSLLTTYEVNGALYRATTGTITVGTNNSVHVAGTFAFNAISATDTKSITAGSFDIYK